MKTYLVIIFLCILSGFKADSYLPDTFVYPYSVRIINDHDVLLIHESDTLILSLENAYNLEDEQFIYIQQINKWKH